MPAVADTILHGGSILTVDQDMAVAEALAICDGRVQAVGDLADILKLRGSDTTMIDLAGRVATPGFIEPHGHPMLTAFARGEPTVDISAIHGYDTFDAVRAVIRRRAAHAQPGEFLLFFGLDTALCRDMHEPSLDELDALAPDNPIALQTANFHTMFLNRAALAHFCITDKTKDPPGGHINRLPDGAPSGKLEERANALVLVPYAAALGESRAVKVFSEWLWKFSRAGYTTTSEQGALPHYILFFDNMVAGGRSPVRVRLYHAMNSEMIVGAPLDHGDDYFSVVGCKLIADGSPFVGNIWTSKPYLNTDVTLKGMGLAPDHIGQLNWKPEEITDMVDRYAAQGWQVSVHVQGDLTFDVVLDAFEAAIHKHKLKDHRFRLEHCALLQPRHIERAMQLGVTCSFFLSHLYFWGEVLRDSMFGPERAATYMPIGDAWRSGMRTSVHCDPPMTEPDPIRCLSLAATRRTRRGEVIGAGQTVPVAEALRAITINAAWQLKMEDRIGSLEPGKLADITLLDANPLEVAPENLINLKVLGTWVAGKPVWQA
jgi:predicted amidohydrolase YtcJ